MRKVKILAGVGALVMVSCVMFAWAIPFTETGSMITLGAGGTMTMTLLPDNTVLATGGYDGLYALSTAEIYDSTPGTFATTGSMNSARYLHSAVTVTSTNKVLITGGKDDYSVLNTAETFTLGVFTATTGTMKSARHSHASTLLPGTDKVLITGGHDGVSALDTAEVFVSSSGTFTYTTGSMNSARYLHTATTITTTGQILIIGGKNASDVAKATAELYSSVTDTFAPTTGSMSVARFSHTATLMNSGLVLITGGHNGTNALSSAEIYSSVTGTFATTGTMVSARYGHKATLLDNGKVLITGGRDATDTPLMTAEVYDPATGLFTATTADMFFPRYDHQALLLQNGLVLIAGGYVGVDSPLGAAELFDITQNINETTTTLDSSLNPSNIGKTVTFTATIVRTAGTATVGGTVTFYTGGTTTLATRAVTAGVATYSTSVLPVATHSITALYNGDANYNTSTSDTLSQIVSYYTTTTGLSLSRTSVGIGETVTLTAAVSRGTATAYTVGGTVTFKDGAATLGTKSVVSGKAIYSTGTSTFTLGVHDFTAEYNGDTKYDVSTSPSATMLVSLNTTTTGVSSSRPAGSNMGAPVIFTAIVSRGTSTIASPVSGTVTFFDTDASSVVTTLGTSTIAILSSKATATIGTSALALGSHSITAAYNGDSNYDLSTSATLTQLVSINTTTTGVATSRASAKVGETVTFTATVSRGTATISPVTGNVTFYSGGTTTLGTGIVSSGPPYLATYGTSTLDIAVHSITAKYNGDLNYDLSTSPSVTQTVIIVPTSATLASTGPSKIGDPVTFSATISQLTSTTTGTCPTPISGSVIFKKNGTTMGSGIVSGGSTTAVATYISSAATFTASGSYIITADYSGDANFALSTAPSITQVVSQQTGTIILDNLSQVYSASTKTVSVTTVPPGLPVTVTFSSAPISAGSYTVTAVISSPTRTGSTTGTLVITPKLITITGMKANTKVYDGGLTSTITSSLGTAVGLAPGDTVNWTAAGVFADKNVGTSKLVSVTTVTFQGTKAGNYTITVPFDITGTITPKPLTIVGMAINNKTFDGTTAATLSSKGTLTALVSGDTVTIVPPTLVFSQKNVGTRAVSMTSLASALLGGTDAANYSTSFPNGLSGIISKATLTVTAIGKNKVYDGTVKSSPTLSSNRVAGDSFILSYVTASFDTKDVGVGKTVSVSGISFSGTSVVNYTLGNTTATTTADITAKPLTIVGRAADSREYDGSVSATFTKSPGTLSGIITGETGTANVLFSIATSTFSSSTAGVGKSIVLGAISLSGAKAGNYAIVTPPKVVGTITPRKLLVSGMTVTDKTYDRTTVATLSSTGTLSRVVGSDDVDIVTGVLNFIDKKVGVNKTVLISSVTLTGADKANYIATLPTTTITATILPKSLTVTAIGKNKIYDGTVTSLPTYSDNRIKGDVIVTTGTASFALRSVGTHTVDVTGITISSTDAGNYSLLATTATTTASITPKALTITGMKADTKEYDGTNLATFSTVTSLGTLKGVAAGDVGSSLVSLSVGTSYYADKKVAPSKLVTLGTITLVGTEAGNYTVGKPAIVYGAITAKPLTVTATGIDKVWDGYTTADVILNYNMVSGDDLTLSGIATFADSDAGANKIVTVRSITKAGADAAYYSLVTGLTVTTTASIF